jgi:hypothetical protein
MTVFALLTVSAAHAMTGDWERPVLQARMDIIEAQAPMTNVRQAELIMTQKDGAPSATGFILQIDGQRMGFEISKLRRDACGVDMYIGMPSVQYPGHAFRLVVVDRTHDSCTYPRGGNYHALPVQPAFEALLLDQSEGQVETTLRMTGDPEALITPQ